MSNLATTIDSGARARVIIIDDDPQIRSLLTSFLRREFLVSVAADGQEGFQKAQEHVPDVAVIDIHMPVWDGLQTLKMFRALPALRGVRVVMLTADSSRQTVMTAIAHGADDYIVKTALSKDDLLAKLRRARDATAAVPQPQFLAAAQARETPRAPAPAPHVPLPTEGPSAETPETVAAAVPEEAQLQAIIDAWE
jgi:DNA-binding response OmpR family regulator